MKYDSPILSLRDAIAEAPHRIARHKEREFVEIRDGHNLSLRFTDERGFAFEVSLTSHVISLSILALEYLWSVCHLFIVTVDEYQRQNELGITALDFSLSSRTRNAWELYTRSFENMKSGEATPWPPYCPSPLATEVRDVKTSNELFLCALSWIIHHEIAHVHLGHIGDITVTSIPQENEADAQATAWLLEGQPSEQEFQKCLISIVSAILAMKMAENVASTPFSKTHPETFQRLERCLLASNVHDDNEVYVLINIVLRLHLTVSEINPPPPVEGSLRKNASELMCLYLAENKI